MRLFWDYLRGNKKIFITVMLFWIVFAGSFYLYHIPPGAVLYPALLCFGIGGFICMIDFFYVAQKHKTLQRVKRMTDVISENFPKTETIQEKEYQRIISLLYEEHKEFRTETDKKYADMVEYYSVWAHQIKTPIASMRLHLQNEDTPLARKVTLDLHRIEQYVEMVLTFLRLNSQTTDYVIKEQDVDKIVRQSVKKFSSEFIGNKISLIYEPLNATVVTDEKWLSFVVEQVLSNALKYTKSGSVSISLVGEKILRIEDTGIGIAPEDLPRIFENGYTGYNGRADRKASGIGLYLCKRICTNLGHEIEVKSVPGIGTTVEIHLSQNKVEVE